MRFILPRLRGIMEWLRIERANNLRLHLVSPLGQGCPCFHHLPDLPRRGFDLFLPLCSQPYRSTVLHLPRYVSRYEEEEGEGAANDYT